MTDTTADGSSLLQAARAARETAYAPYSGWQVGAAAEFAGAGGPYPGANVENASFGLTICAERAAIVAGVVAGGRRLVRIALSCRDRSGAAVADVAPCGACLQVMAEFGSADTVIEIDGRGCLRLADFLPRPVMADELRG